MVHIIFPQAQLMPEQHARINRLVSNMRLELVQPTSFENLRNAPPGWCFNENYTSNIKEMQNTLLFWNVPWIEAFATNDKIRFWPVSWRHGTTTHTLTLDQARRAKWFEQSPYAPHQTAHETMVVLAHNGPILRAFPQPNV